MSSAPLRWYRLRHLLREHRRLVTHREEDLTERLVAGLRAIDGVETFSIFGGTTTARRS